MSVVDWCVVCVWCAVWRRREPAQLVRADGAGGGEQVHGVARRSRDQTDAARSVYSVTVVSLSSVM